MFKMKHHLENRYEDLAIGMARHQIFTVATVPDATKCEGCTIYVQNGAGGSQILAFSDGTNWLRSDTGAAIAAS